GLVLLIQGSEQAPQPDADSAQVGDLVDLQLGVQLAARLQDLPCLVGGDGVHAAAEGDQLHQVHIPLGAAVAGCRVETGVVGPLVQHRGGEFLHPVGDGVLRDDRGAGAGNQSVDAVVDLRVHVIGPACQHDDPAALCPGLVDDPFPLLADEGHVVGVLGVGGVGCLLHLALGDVREVAAQDGEDLFGEVLGPVEAHIVIDELGLLDLWAVAG
ncbi:Streptogramin A acetyltransferase, partial [Dysosmobacter welbionis]